MLIMPHSFHVGDHLFSFSKCAQRITMVIQQWCHYHHNGRFHHFSHAATRCFDPCHLKHTGGFIVLLLSRNVIVYKAPVGTSFLRPKLPLDRMGMRGSM